MRPSHSSLILAVAVVACGGGAPVADAGRTLGDAGPRLESDAGTSGGADAGTDAGPPVDASVADAGTPDAGAPADAGTPDAGSPADAGASPDAGSGPSCQGLPDVVTFDFVWADSSSVLTMSTGGLRASAIAVGRVLVPPSATMPLGQPGQVRFVEYIDGQAQRQMTLSPFPCDFRGFVAGGVSRTDPTGAAFPMAWSNDINTQLIFRLSPPGLVLQPGRTYFVNLRNVDWVTGQPSCQTASCNGLFNFFAPR